MTASLPAPPAGPPPSGPPRASSGASALSLSSRQLLAIGVAVAVILAVVVGVVATSGGSTAHGQTVQLEPTGARGANPFMPPLSDDASTPPSTLSPPLPGDEAFGGSGDDGLCDKTRLVSFLTDSSHGAQAQAWSGIVGITTDAIPTYVDGLVATVLDKDTAVTNHSFVGGRAVPYQAVLQAGTAVLVDTQGRLIARCRSGNPLVQPRPPANPVYTGPRWPSFSPKVIVVVAPSSTQIFTAGGLAERTKYDTVFTAQARNIASTDSLTTVFWRATMTVARNGTIAGTGTGALVFSGNCFRNLVQYSDVQLKATFDVAIAGTAAGQRPNRTYALTFTPGPLRITDLTGANLDARCRTDASALAPLLVAGALGPQTVPAARATNRLASGSFNLVLTLF